MKVVFVSNFLNHHQIPLCESFISRCDSFYFIATEAVSNIGYQKASAAAYVLNYFEEENRIHCEQLICEADAVIFGACPNHLIALRVQKHKLSFLFSERFFKKGTWRRFIPSTRKKITERIVQYKNEPIYVLCASAYLSYDLALLGYPTEKCYRWGYFPEVKKYENIDELIKTKKKASILWVARLIEWKHPDASIYVAKRLKQAGYNFQLNIIGNGVLEDEIRQRISDNDLEDCVHMLGAMKPEQVREYMEQSEIFLFTSDRNEGWGAVLNESMNSGCAVVASSTIGSVPFLINDKENGLIYKDGDLDELFEKTKWLLEHEAERKQIAKNAYLTMTKEWNAENAAKRFLELSESILKGEKAPIVVEEGMCGKAEILKNNWYE